MGENLPHFEGEGQEPAATNTEWEFDGREGAGGVGPVIGGGWGAGGVTQLTGK